MSTAYHVGFAYFMLRRYTDAIRHFNASLVFINRHKVAATRPYALDLLLKKQEQMYALVAMAVTLGGSGAGGGSNGNNGVMRLLEEGVVGALREKHGDDMSRMAQGVVSAFDEMFSFSCPKFVTPSPPEAPGADGEGAGANFNEEAYRAQLKTFIAEVGSFEKLPALRSYLKLYTTISIAKLADLMEIEPARLQEQLATMKAKSVMTEWRGGASALDDASKSPSRTSPSSSRERRFTSRMSSRRSVTETISSATSPSRTRSWRIWRRRSLSCTRGPSEPRRRRA